MAMFATHLGAAVVGGTVLANAGHAAGVFGRGEFLPVIGLVVIGGLLPDIDAKQSHSVRILFAVLGVLAMVAVSLPLRDHMPLLPALLASIGAYAIVRHGIFHVFNALSTHRGNAHSLLTMLFAGTLTAVVTYQTTGSSILGWVYGLSVMAGVLIHLLLDELYSVDIAGVRLKKSFGTAVKLIDVNYSGLKPPSL